MKKLFGFLPVFTEISDAEAVADLTRYMSDEELVALATALTERVFDPRAVVGLVELRRLCDDRAVQLLRANMEAISPQEQF